MFGLAHNLSVKSKPLLRGSVNHLCNYRFLFLCILLLKVLLKKINAKITASSECNTIKAIKNNFNRTGTTKVCRTTLFHHKLELKRFISTVL